MRDMHVGRLSSSKLGVQLPQSGLRLEKKTSSKTCLLVGTVYGEISCLAPVDERTYRRLLLLQQIIGSVMETTCALNPREYRFIKTAEVHHA